MDRNLTRAWPLVAALLVAGSVLLTGCGIKSPTPTPQYTIVPLEATPWPDGTMGKYGLRIDPQLLSGLPELVGGLPLVESAPIEIIALDDADQHARFESFAAAQAGSATSSDWVVAYVGKVRADDQTEQFLSSWRDEFDQGACSQADGVAKVEEQTINDWPVYVATCKGGSIAYTLWIQDGMLLSIQELGPRHLGFELIMDIN